MNALSRQVLNYLELSEQDDKLARSNLCHLILLVDRHYQDKLKHIDEALLLRILCHLADCYLRSMSDMDKDKFARTEQLIKKLTLSNLSVENLRDTAFARCTYYADELLGRFYNNQVKLTEISEEKIEPQRRSSDDAENYNQDDINTEINVVTEPVTNSDTDYNSEKFVDTIPPQSYATALDTGIFADTDTNQY